MGEISVLPAEELQIFAKFISNREILPSNSND